MILNNCTTCGRKPKIGYAQITGFNAWCSCGKTVFSDFGIWPDKEVAADMWNRANPEREREKPDFINFLAAEICKAGLSVYFDENGEVTFSGKVKAPVPNLALECIRYRNELTDFYKNRLQTEARA